MLSRMVCIISRTSGTTRKLDVRRLGDRIRMAWSARSHGLTGADTRSYETHWLAVRHE